MLTMHPTMNAGPTMIRGNTDLPYLNQALLAHRATHIVYRKGPCHKVQLVVPSAPRPSPQSAAVQTLGLSGRRSNTSSNLRAAYRQIESDDTEAGSEAKTAEVAETGHIRHKNSSHDHGEERYLQSQGQVIYEEVRPRDRGVRAKELDDRLGKDTLGENDEGKDVAPIIVRTHRALCATEFENSGNADDGDNGGLDLEANTRWSNSNEELTSVDDNTASNRGEHSKRNSSRMSQGDSGFFGQEPPEEEDWMLEMIPNSMEMGQARLVAGASHGEEGRDIQMMVRNKYHTYHTLLRKSIHPFRPSGIRVSKTELTQRLRVFRQMRLRLLPENPGRSMARILKKKKTDLRPR